MALICSLPAVPPPWCPASPSTAAGDAAPAFAAAFIPAAAAMLCGRNAAATAACALKYAILEAAIVI